MRQQARQYHGITQAQIQSLPCDRMQRLRCIAYADSAGKAFRFGIQTQCITIAFAYMDEIANALTESDLQCLQKFHV